MKRYLALISLLLAGCGYHQSGDEAAPSTGYQWRSLYREDIHTVAVPIFTNLDFHRNVEFELTKAIVNDIESHTPYKVVDRDRADTILEGQITDVKTTTVSRDRNTDLPQEQLQAITVSFIWKDMRSGKILCQRNDFRETKVLYPTLGEGQFTGTETTVEHLATSIVQEMQAEW